MDARLCSTDVNGTPEVHRHEEHPISKAELYGRHLREEGYSPHMDDDGDVVFKFEGDTYLLSCDESDRIYFRLMRPAFWEIESAEEESRALRAVNHVNLAMKVAKLVVVSGYVWASAELYVDPFENFERIFRRCVRLLARCVSDFHEEMFADE